MEKTEKRTAESIVSKNNPNEGWPRWVTKKSAIESCEEYAAQELDAYKARLKEAISKHQLYGETTNLVKRYEILNLIDKL